ncbi:protein kinase [Duganella sp. FT135W]|uniref:Protein kinase n=1 Tax=Duganella flavida TaxID=2692175 RepID=A0A6L8KD71_9BURK|nr:leucine-rich repeat-containing protein kinase family protein [Duganella flavida]MYM25356.1 protein kinase [Duganella flavida]
MHTLEQLRSGALAGITRLTLRCGLTEFPPEIYTLADSLEILDLSGNALSTLPDDLPLLRKLRIIFCSDNQFTELPAVLGACPALTMLGFKANQIRHVPAAALPAALRWLVLTDNEIEELPTALGERPQLQKLMLAGNRLRALPESMAQLHQLELLRIASNQLEELPSWLLSLLRLTWLAYAGNPLCNQLEDTLVHTPSATVRWPELTLGAKLGEGASGVIYRADWRDQHIAVKLFKGSMTSDGSPLSEMAACLGAGAHPNLIPVLGHIEDHPEDAHGLAMSLISPDFHNLAGPPSLDSCTRDIYRDGKRFELNAMLSIARGIASAAAQLHEHGIMHGDLYGHNVLHDDHGHTLLGDFGAASFYDTEGPHAATLQTLEVRAFGNLLEELLDRCDTALPRLRQLQTACQQGGPRFANIKEQLDNPF